MEYENRERREPFNKYLVSNCNFNIHDIETSKYALTNTTVEIPIQMKRGEYQRNHQKKLLNTSKTNNTGIPKKIKQYFEAISGYSFDNVRVHYNSDKPAQLQAFAYTQGNHVYIGADQEEYLFHELAHVIQQKSRVVKPTMKLYGLDINDDVLLEKEADFIAAIAQLQLNYKTLIWNERKNYIIANPKQMEEKSNMQIEGMILNESLVLEEPTETFSQMKSLKDNANQYCMTIQRYANPFANSPTHPWTPYKIRTPYVIRENEKVDELKASLHHIVPASYIKEIFTRRAALEPHMTNLHKDLLSILNNYSTNTSNCDYVYIDSQNGPKTLENLNKLKGLLRGSSPVISAKQYDTIWEFVVWQPNNIIYGPLGIRSDDPGDRYDIEVAAKKSIGENALLNEQNLVNMLSQPPILPLSLTEINKIVNIFIRDKVRTRSIDFFKNLKVYDIKKMYEAANLINIEKHFGRKNISIDINVYTQYMRHVTQINTIVKTYGEDLKKYFLVCGKKEDVESITVYNNRASNCGRVLQNASKY